MPLMTVVVESHPDLRLGFLENPDGKGRIYFDHAGWRKKSNGILQNADTKTKPFPPQGSKVEVLELVDVAQDPPKAVTWRLIERGKKKKDPNE